ALARDGRRRSLQRTRADRDTTARADDDCRAGLKRTGTRDLARAGARNGRLAREDSGACDLALALAADRRILRCERARSRDRPLGSARDRSIARLELAGPLDLGRDRARALDRGVLRIELGRRSEIDDLANTRSRRGCGLRLERAGADDFARAGARDRRRIGLERARSEDPGYECGLCSEQEAAYEAAVLSAESECHY